MTTSVAVVGSGIAGLSAALTLTSEYPNARVVVLEATGTTGGCICSDSRSTSVADRHWEFMFERGPHSFRAVSGSHGPNSGAVLFHLVDVAAKVTGRSPVITKAVKSTAAGRYVWVPSAGRLVRVTLGFAVRSIGVLQLLREMALSVVGGVQPCNSHTTIGSFFGRHFGRFARQVLAPAIVHGVFGGVAENLSLASCFPVLADSHTQWGSLVIGGIFGGLFPGKEPPTLLKPVPPSNAGVHSFTGGMADIAASLTAAVQASEHATIVCGAQVRSIEKRCSPNGRFSFVVRLRDESSTDRFAVFDRVITAVPAHAASFLAPRSVPCGDLRGLATHPHARLGRLMRSIPFTPIVVLNVFVPPGTPLHDAIRTALVRSNIIGFGYLLPPMDRLGRRDEREPILGVIFDSIVFPAQQRCVRDATLLSPANPFAFSIMHRPTNDSVRTLLQLALLRYIGVSTDAANKLLPDDATVGDQAVVHATEWSPGIPQYTPGHADRVESLLTNLNAVYRRRGTNDGGVLLAGFSYWGVSLSWAAYSGYAAARRAMQSC